MSYLKDAILKDAQMHLLQARVHAQCAVVFRETRPAAALLEEQKMRDEMAKSAEIRALASTPLVAAANESIDREFVYIGNGEIVPIRP